MEEKTEQDIKNGVVRRRKKLWEIKEGYLCALLGTCLRQPDLRRIARKRIFQMEPGASDYEIHSVLVNQGAQRNPQSRALHKLLETKYRAAVKRYATATDDETISKLWDQDLQCGAVAGAYWAIMTHSIISKKAMATIYGQSHMMSHSCFSDYQRDQQVLEELRCKAAMLEDIMGSERQHYLEEKKKFENDMSKLRQVQEQSRDLYGENKELREKIESWESGRIERILAKRLADMKLQLLDLRQHNATLCGRLDELTRELEDSRDLFRLADRTIAELEEENSALSGVKEEQAKEIVSLETALSLQMSTTCSCFDCEDQNTDCCPGPDLCGKTVLYVGGLHKMVPRYRQLVEKWGGQFIHHDGGKEISITQLPKMLGSADAVLCPVDCVSHDACNCVKKICKRYQKPFVMMRSSGLSSLAKGLGDIVQ